MIYYYAEDKEFCQEILRIILEDNKLTVLESIPQWAGTNLQGRSVILDAKCIRDNGAQVNIEVQKADDVYNSKFPKTSAAKHRYKETEGGINAMCEIMDRITTEEINKINKLNAILLKNKRYDDLQRTTEDHEFQEKLIMELLSKEEID